MTNGTVLVASPSAMGRMPDASGSSVPAWPAFLALSARLTTATAWVEVMPTPLSSTIQPLTSRFLGRGGEGEGSFIVAFVSVPVIRGAGQANPINGAHPDLAPPYGSGQDGTLFPKMVQSSPS